MWTRSSWQGTVTPPDSRLGVRLGSRGGRCRILDGAGWRAATPHVAGSLEVGQFGQCGDRLSGHRPGSGIAMLHGLAAAEGAIDVGKTSLVTDANSQVLAVRAASGAWTGVRMSVVEAHREGRRVGAMAGGFRVPIAFDRRQ